MDGIFLHILFFLTNLKNVFKKMLNNDCPPDDWNSLFEEAKAESNRLEKINELLDDSEI